mgnify:CR=1 FL=1
MNAPALHPPVPEPDRVSFSPVFEGLLREHRATLSATAVSRLRDAGIDVSKPLLAAYPYRAWRAAVRILAEEQYPAVPYEAAVREVGRDFMRGYFETTLGRTVLVVLRLLGPRRSLQRMSRNFRTGNNFSETWMHEDAPGDVRLEVNDALADVPTFIQGLIEVVLEKVGAEDASVEVLAPAPNGHDLYRVRWKV